jgi:hypothetical protein
MPHLDFAKAGYLAITRRLSEEHPDLDERTLSDTVEGLTDLHEIVAAVVRAAITDEALGKGLRLRLTEMQDRLSRLDERACKRRQIAREVMVECGIKQITAPDFTISIRSGTPAVVVTDETAIPPQYWQPRDPRLDRQSLSTDLKGGAAIPGAVLSNAEPVLSVRVK